MNDRSDELFPDGTRRAGGDVVLAGRYKVVRELGRGAMGAVYLAEDMTLDDLRVAIKMLPAVLAADPSAMAGLKREALLARKLSHPHIVTLRHFEHTDAGVFLVMDYVEGNSLAHTLAENGPLAEAEVQSLFEPLAKALDYAHGQGVVHRDIKPSNIMLQRDGTAFLTDFGIACEMKESLTRVTGRSSSGTLPYMSPEQFTGEIPAPTHDVYSFAATIYDCLAGNPPFHRGQIEWQILNQEPAALPRGSSHLPASVLRGLSKEAGGRPSSCRELMAEPAHPAGPTHEAAPTRSASRFPNRQWALALLVLVAVAVGAWALLGPGRGGESGSGGSSSTPPIPSRDASEGTPPVVAVTATLDSPLEGAWVRTRSVSVRGQVKGDGSQLLLNGEPLAAAGGAFVGQVVAEKDGDLRIEVSTSSGQKLTERTVHVDTTRPLIEITSSSRERITIDQPLVRIEGRVVEAHPATLTANGKRITPEASGYFMWPLTLEAGKPLTIAFKATDQAGNESLEVTRTLTYEKPPEAFEATVSSAEAAAGKGAWREASRLLDAAISQGLPTGRSSPALVQGVERWKAPPTLEITSPRDGAQIAGLTVRLSGRLKTGRKDDQLAVDGNRIPLEAGGRFSVNLPYAKAGTYRIGIEVLDDKGARRGGATRTVTLLSPVLKTPSWAKVSVEQKTEAAMLNVPVAFENKLGMQFVLIPAGEFWMGSPDTEEPLDRDETLHRVRVAEAYYLQVTEVTNGQYGRKDGGYKGRSSGLRKPVGSVSWDDATAYAKWLSSLDAKRTYVLPTEAQWEYACRAGTSTPYAFGYTISTDQANYRGDVPYRRGRKGVDRKQTVDVGTLARNGWGLHDLHGNVIEWCSDYYGAYLSKRLTIDPTGPSSGQYRVVRGGSWSDGPRMLRSAVRVSAAPGERAPSLGFRLVVRLRR